MICPLCATENALDSRFCNECGGPLAAGCQSCGAVNKPGAKFCNECGSAMVGASREPGPAVQTLEAPVAERRLVTVVFADIVGFTPFAEERDAEEVRDLLSRYFELCAQIVERYGGTIEKFIGDAVMAVWGAPLAHEDDAERAVRAALDLVDSMGTLGDGVQARAAALTGEAVVTIGATNQGLVAGDMVNTAARLQSIAPSGAVLVGESTMRASSNAIVYELAGDETLKGKQAPVAAWRAMRVVAERGGRNRSQRLEAPFVGRADELRLLKDLFHATGREQKVRLVSVMGPAGIGKSRLAWEFVKYVDGLVETTLWHDGRSPAYGDGVSFWALGEMVRGRCGLLETDDEPTTREKVAQTMAQWVSDPQERAWIEPALLALLGIEAAQPPDEMFAAWRTFFERISEQGTVTLVFEDMHFADPGLLDFIDHLLSWSRGHPIYIVTLARPELLDKQPDWAAAKRSFTSLYIEPLTEPEMCELLSGLAPGLPDKAVQAIIKRADGMPLYAVETVRMLVADGRLVERDGTYGPVGDMTNLAVPETLTALIGSRLDALDAADRQLVHDASVLGQSFPVSALAAVSGSEPAVVETRLKGLVRRELLRQEVDPRSPERGQYVFVQALIREVAYGTLAKRDRMSRHLAAARYFEQTGSDELAGALAGHYLAAYANASSGAEADALRAQARIALRAAGDRAANLGAYDHATRFYEQALAIAAADADAAEFHLLAGRSAARAAHFEVAESHLRDALRIETTLDSEIGAAKAATALGSALLGGLRFQQALTALRDAFERYAGIMDPDVSAELRDSYASALVNSQLFSEGIAMVDEALDIAEHFGLREMVGRCFVTKGFALSQVGRLYEASTLLRAAEELARQNGFDSLLFNALDTQQGGLGEIEPQRAWEWSREALTLARRSGRRDRLIRAVNNMGYTGYLVGEWDLAQAELDALVAEEDIETAARIWLTSNWVIVHAARGDDVALELERLDQLVREADEPDLNDAARDARATAALAVGDMLTAGNEWRMSGAEYRSQAPWAYYQAGRCAFWSGDLDTLRSDMELFDAAGIFGRTVDARRLSLHADLAALEGQMAAALVLYQQALKAWRDLGQTWDVALTGLDALTALDPSDPAVAQIASETREILVRLGARPFLERLAAAVGRSFKPRISDSSGPVNAARLG